MYHFFRSLGEICDRPSHPLAESKNDTVSTKRIAQLYNTTATTPISTRH